MRTGTGVGTGRSRWEWRRRVQWGWSFSDDIQSMAREVFRGARLIFPFVYEHIVSSSRLAVSFLITVYIGFPFFPSGLITQVFCPRRRRSKHSASTVVERH